MIREYVHRGTNFYRIFSRTYHHLKELQKNHNDHSSKQKAFKTRVQSWAKEIIEILNIKIEIEGNPHSREPVIFIGNHSSYLDIPVLSYLTEGVFLAKAEIARWPIIGTAAKAIDTIFVQRSSAFSGRKSYEKIRELLLQKRRNVIIFPSGTTSLNEEQPWKKGAFRLAQECQVLIQPFHLKLIPEKLTAFLGNDSLIPHLWRLLGQKKIDARVYFHPPVSIVDPKKDCEHWWQWNRALSRRLGT